MMIDKILRIITRLSILSELAKEEIEKIELKKQKEIYANSDSRF